MPRSPEWSAAYRKLDEAAHELHQLMDQDHDEPGDPKSFPTDYVLLVGSMWVDSDDDRCGGVSFFPKDGSQPAYITIGLLESVQCRLTGRG